MFKFDRVGRCLFSKQCFPHIYAYSQNGHISSQKSFIQEMVCILLKCETQEMKCYAIEQAGHTSYDLAVALEAEEFHKSILCMT